MKKLNLHVLLLFMILSGTMFAQSDAATDINKIIRKHGMEQSKVAEISSMICDVHGPRLSGSQGLADARKWAESTLKEWGMANVKQEAWGPFGRGWELKHFEMHASSPQYWQVIAYPKAWSPSTKGLVSGEVIYIEATEEADLEKYKGKLKGKFVLFDPKRETKEWFESSASRYDADRLLKLANEGAPVPRPRRNWNNLGGMTFNKVLWKFLYDEQPLAVLDRGSKGDLGTVFVSGARVSNEDNVRAYDEQAMIVPQATLAVEHYNRLMRLLEKGVTPKISMEIKAEYQSPAKGMEYNVLAEIPGTDLKDEVVMFGAHFDSWHTGTGATDNGAGSSVMMEAARILLETIKESGIQPRRTLRLALWTGEEQGLYGSANYVREHLAETEPGGWIPKALKPEHEKISAYYNLDNGTGKIRGIYAQGNQAVVPIFRPWLDEFKDLDAATISLANTGGTDHLPFDGVGIPGFQFIQEPIAYFNSTHHSNMDNWDHLIEADLKQAATIIASFVWNTSQRDEKLPRKALEIENQASSQGSNK
ncbi:MAG: M28 family peptidase [Saprospiraceae bacterium]|nr:M28 family peptidase [Saprospiraceae bacterium]